jgi:hypothetical protein
VNEGCSWNAEKIPELTFDIDEELLACCIDWQKVFCCVNWTK